MVVGCPTQPGGRSRPRRLADVSDVSGLPLIGAAALRARAAARVLRTLPTDTKDAALAAMAEALVERADEILDANAEDVEAARADGTGQVGDPLQAGVVDPGGAHDAHRGERHRVLPVVADRDGGEGDVDLAAGQPVAGGDPQHRRGHVGRGGPDGQHGRPDAQGQPQRGVRGEVVHPAGLGPQADRRGRRRVPGDGSPCPVRQAHERRSTTARRTGHSARLGRRLGLTGVRSRIGHGVGDTEIEITAERGGPTLGRPGNRR